MDTDPRGRMAGDSESPVGQEAPMVAALGWGQQVAIGVLGPLLVRVDDSELTVSAPKERGVLGLLAIRNGAVVGTDELVQATWGDDPPRSAAKALQIYISALRRALPGGAITTHPQGYRLGLGTDSVDAARFEALVGTARRVGEA